MMGRSAWPTILVVATLLSWLEAASCTAQSPPTPGSPTPAPARRVQPPVSPSGRTLIARAVDPNQAVLSMPEDQGLVKLKEAPLEPTDLRFPINLATALRLSDARPLIVAAAQASVWVAEAQLTRARVLWIPTLMTGFDYIRHDGGGPDFNKGIMTAPSVNFFYGGTGMWQMVNLTDAIFQPLAARQVLNARHWDIQTAKNDALMQVADAYFRVHQYRGMYAGALYTVERGHDLVERIASLSQDLVRRVDVDRARNMLADLEQRAVSAREQWRVASADLTQVLRLDPRAVVVPLEHDHLQVTLIEPGRELDDLIPIALGNRPEVATKRALVQAAVARVRREKMRPLLPVVMINGFQSAQMYIQAGIFGLGPNSSLNQWTGRVDLSYQLMWQLEAFGIGNLARIKEQRGEESRAIVELFKTQDMVAADVTRARANLQSAALRVVQADRALRTGLITFNANYEGLQQTTRFGDVLVLVYRPQEAVYALQLLNIAFNEYFTTVADYNRAQFELFHAMGYPAAEIALQHPPGDVLPVDLDRPTYLPRVGNGPPPASR
jgi:outer membrane protein TolC